MDLKKIIDKKDWAAKYTIDEITHIIKTFEKRDPGSKGEKQCAEYMAKIMEKEITDEMLENLAKSEHHRWCAFHYSMGYSSMSDEVKNKRAKMYEQDKSVRITKDTVNKLHACLIPWDDLDELSDYENALTGRNVDYKQSDRDNIITVMKILTK